MTVGRLEVYKQNNLTFIFDDKKIIIKTSLQAFFLEPKEHYWKRRVDLIRLMITIDEVRSLDELAKWCGRGVSWVPTTHYNHLKVDDNV